MSEEKEIQKKIEDSSPLGRSSLEDTGLKRTEMFSLVRVIDEILTINEVFLELGEDEYFLYLLLMSYAQKILIYDSENADETDKKIKKTEINRMLRDAFNGAKALHKSKLEANIDPLTNIWTRRALESRLSEVMKVIKESEKSNSPKSAFFCFIDADDFKSINDTYGHTAGDHILKKLAELMKDNTDASDFSARIGGDEFAILLVFPKEKREKMKKRIVEIHHQITKNLYIFAYPRLNVGKAGKKEKVSLEISIGVAEVTTETTNLEEVTDLADELLTKAKDKLRKNVVIFEDDEPTSKTTLVQKALDLLKNIFQIQRT